MKALPQQFELPSPPTWGGRRAGAGREPLPGRRRVSHRRRPIHDARCPVHVTLRVRAGLPSLRRDGVFGSIHAAFARASGDRFRLLQFSVQRDHIHLLVEGDGAIELRRGVQGLAIRVAKAINRTLCRQGRIWADRYHARALRTPREVRNALVYVLQNWRKHEPDARGLDPRSSAASFSGWRAYLPRRWGRLGVTSPRTWLAGVGWRRYGLLNVDERPHLPSRRARRKSRLRPAGK